MGIIICTNNAGYFLVPADTGYLILCYVQCYRLCGVNKENCVWFGSKCRASPGQFVLFSKSPCQSTKNHLTFNSFVFFLSLETRFQLKSLH